MTDNEKLIEEARGFAAGSDSARATLLRDLADALEAAEKAHTPTDDKRESLIKSYEGWDFVEVALNPNGASRVIADLAARLDLALRRSEVPEPSAEHPDHSKLGPSACPACDFDPMASQGEPSDAQVGAAMHAVERYYVSQGITSVAESVDYQAMRAALRAAGGV